MKKLFLAIFKVVDKTECLVEQRTPAVLVELPDGLDQSWHNAPTRQLVFVLEGRIEVETSDGSKCSWGKGDLFFADDVAGKGHLTRVVHGLTKLLFLRLSDQFNLEKFLEDTDKG